MNIFKSYWWRRRARIDVPRATFALERAATALPQGAKAQATLRMAWGNYDFLLERPAEIRSAFEVSLLALTNAQLQRQSKATLIALRLERGSLWEWSANTQIVADPEPKVNSSRPTTQKQSPLATNKPPRLYFVATNIGKGALYRPFDRARAPMQPTPEVADAPAEQLEQILAELASCDESDDLAWREGEEYTIAGRKVGLLHVFS